MRIRALSYGTGILVFLLDRITKSLIQQNVSIWDTFTVIPGFFNIIHTENPGASFSLFANSQPEWRNFFLIGLTSVALVLISALLWQPGGRVGESRWLRIGLALILGGGLGNLYDRILTGTVTDFLEFYLGSYHWPAFNAADTAICVGAALVILDMARARHPAPKTT